ncbi:hypothetical protein [Amnibacterium setariae]|uniref:Uncharacterized protein n=1 Tax=Amnibacterium setariae TaxID=2306585 RepID=A0A3A1U0L3_9MICO|nr:hypothetical protein [Amnibacterium setariae]RIX30455.1 hypothetical protein D1781_03230 [Amnibacterium setariae]
MTRRRRAGRRTAGLWRTAAAAVLGFTRRDAAPPPRTPWRDRSASSYEAPLAADDQLQLGRAAQLPPFGRGNGIDALFWVPLARLDGDRVDAAFAALAAADIAAWAAPVRGRRDGVQDLFVAAMGFETAEDLLRPVLRRED